MRLVCHLLAFALARAATWQQMKAVRRDPSRYGEPWRRFGAWWSISGQSGNNAWANVAVAGLRAGQGWYGANSSLWTEQLSRLPAAGVHRVLFHLPFGKVTGEDMEFTRYVRCVDGYPGVHDPLPWLVKGFVPAMRTLREQGVSVVIYYGTLNCFRQQNGVPRGDSLLRGHFHEIEPNWNLSDPGNPATSGYYKHQDPRFPYATRGAFNVSKSPRHAELTRRLAAAAGVAEARGDADATLWPGVMKDLCALRDGYSNATAEHALLDLIQRSLAPLAAAQVEGIGMDSLSTAPPESMFYQLVRLLDAHGIEVLAEPLVFGGPAPPTGRWPQGDAWKRFGSVTADRFYSAVHAQAGAAKAQDLDELSVLQIQDALFNGTTWPQRGQQWRSWIAAAPNRCPWVHLGTTLNGVSGLAFNWTWVWSANTSSVV